MARRPGNITISAQTCLFRGGKCVEIEVVHEYVHVFLQEAEATCGYAVGTVPPFGHKQRIPTLVDSNLLIHSKVPYLRLVLQSEFVFTYRI
jgi:hypothetical protein